MSHIINYYDLVKRACVNFYFVLSDDGRSANGNETSLTRPRREFFSTSFVSVNFQTPSVTFDNTTHSSFIIIIYTANARRGSFSWLGGY